MIDLEGFFDAICGSRRPELMKFPAFSQLAGKSPVQDRHAGPGKTKTGDPGVIREIGLARGEQARGEPFANETAFAKRPIDAKS